MPELTPTVPDCRADIEIIEVHYLGGPNRWTYRPVLEAVVDIGLLEDFPSHRIPGFAGRLAAWLPGLVEHRCSPGVRGGFLHRLREGTWPAHILEHVTLELQTLAGVPTGFGRARETSRRGVYRVIVRAFDEQAARQALAQARELVLAAILDRPFDCAAAVARVRTSFLRHGPGAGSTAVAMAAEKRGVPFLRTDAEDLMQFGHGSRQRRMRAAETDRTSAIAEGISCDEDLVRELLSGCGIPVAMQDCVAGTATEETEQRLSALSRYRLLVVDDRMVAAVRMQAVPGSGGDARMRARDTGMQAQNGQPAAADSAVPTTGEAADVTSRVHPDLAAMAVLAVRVIGLDIAGVDLVAEDVSRAPGEQRAAVTAVQADPDLGLHLHDAADAAQAIGEAILASLFRDGIDGRIPIIGVAGTGDTTAVAQNLSWLLQDGAPQRDGLPGSGWYAGNDGNPRIGLANREGVFLDGRRITDGDGTNRETARRLLSSRLVDVAIIENGIDVMATQGLAYDRCSVGVVTSLAPDARVEDFDIHGTEALRTVLRTQVDVVLPGGVAVLDAADGQIASMASLCDGEIIFFAASPAGAGRIAAHLAAGGRAVRIEGGFIVLCAGTAVTPLVPVQTPGLQTTSTWLPAIAAAWATGVTPAQLTSRITMLSTAAADEAVAAEKQPVVIFA